MNYIINSIESQNTILDTSPLIDSAKKPHLLKAGSCPDTLVTYPKMSKSEIASMKKEMLEICGDDTDQSSIDYALETMITSSTSCRQTEDICKHVFNVLVTLEDGKCMLVYLPETFTHLSLSLIYYLRSRAFSRCLLYRPKSVENQGCGSFLLCAQYRRQSDEQLGKLQLINTLSDSNNAHLFFEIPNDEYHIYYNKFMNEIKIYNCKIRNTQKFLGRKRRRNI